jgi:hypothetical protein
VTVNHDRHGFWRNLLPPLGVRLALLVGGALARRFASIRTCEYRESVARETCPAMLMIASSPDPGSASSVTSVWRLLRQYRRSALNSP